MARALLLSTAALLFPLSAFPQADPKVIYGKDDRIDLYRTDDERLLRLADSVVSLFHGAEVEVSSGRAALYTEPYGESRELCKDEPFWEQRAGAFCSGSLVAPDMVMTAGHCVRGELACMGTRVVFGFAIREEGGQTPTSVPAGEVYQCAGIVGENEETQGADWALIRLDRPVTNHKPIAINRDAGPPKGAPLFVIGHPAGLPLKIAGGAQVRDPSPGGYFVANLDTYGGNSGSPVFNALTGRIEGILVRGEKDYVTEGGCTRSNVCADDACRGEDVTKISALAGLIPKQGPAAALRDPGPALSALLEGRLRDTSKFPDF